MTLFYLGDLKVNPIYLFNIILIIILSVIISNNVN